MGEKREGGWEELGEEWWRWWQGARKGSQSGGWNGGWSDSWSGGASFFPNLFPNWWYTTEVRSSIHVYAAHLTPVTIISLYE